MADFSEAYKALDAVEGGWGNHPADAGGETYKGIARNFHPGWAGWQLVDNMKAQPGFPENLRGNEQLESLAVAFYVKMFWEPIDGRNIKSDVLATVLFDIAVNMHPKTAITMLQRILNFLNDEEDLFKDLKVDGAAGQKTRAALNAVYIRFGNETTDLLVRLLRSLQGTHYIESTETAKVRRAFSLGWTRRLLV